MCVLQSVIASLLTLVSSVERSQSYAHRAILLSAPRHVRILALQPFPLIMAPQDLRSGSFREDVSSPVL